MPQLRWTLLGLGVLFIILLAWIERRRQRRQMFSDSTTVEKDLAHGSSGLAHGSSGLAHGSSGLAHGSSGLPPGSSGPAPHGAAGLGHRASALTGEGTSAQMLREPALTLPEMRASREPASPQELPVVEIEDDSLNVVEAREPLREPPTLSLPVVDSGPEMARRRPAEPTVSDFDSLKLSRTDEFATAGDFQVPRLDTPAMPGAPGSGATARPVEPVKADAPAKIAPGTKPGSNKINLADPYIGTGDSEERAFNEAVFGDPSPGETDSTDSDDLHTRTDVLAKSGPISRAQSESRTQFLGGAAPPAPQVRDDQSDHDVSAAPRFTAADVTPIVDPIVEWPPDDQRRVVSLRLVASPTERFPGRALRLALASEGFVLGKFQIFHKPDESGRAVLSAANLSKPGTFDMATIDSQRFGGLSLFTVLPGPRPPLKAFEDLLTAARNLNERLNGALQDERGGPLTPTRIASLRDSLAAETPS
jgi:hypothetical protein